MKGMKGIVARWALFLGLSALSFYTLHGDTSVPDLALQSVKLLKKSIEELLPDLQKTQEPETAEAVQSATLELEPYQDLHNERERWNEMRHLIEAGQPLFTPLPSEQEIKYSSGTTGRLAPQHIDEPGFKIRLPYESSLSVSGRKTIGTIFRSSNYSNSTYAANQGLASSQSNFELQQQLQVRINGLIGRKVTVNVDFDDTKEDKKDISIVYKGDPDEIVQRAAFGDINLSLPQTEFAGYSKQVFGASAEVKYKALRGYFIGSRTKGQTETKEFVGNVILQRLNIPDTAYIRRKYYNYTQLYTDASHTSKRDADKTNNLASLNMKVFLDTRDVTRPTASLTTRTPYPDLLNPTTNYTGQFIQLAQGVDYTVDPSSGVITLRTPVAQNAVIAIDYTPPGATLSLAAQHGSDSILLKYDENVVAATGLPQTEEVTHYNIGIQKIVRDNGQGNFTLQLRDLGNNPIGQNVGVQYLPNNAGQIYVDFEGGVFTLKKRLDASAPQYAPVYNFTPTTQSSFFIEFRSRVKTYVLRPNIVINSERIIINGRPLVRDVDYFIDYESGFLTFFNEDQITEDSHIQATYDYSPFGIAGAQQDTLVGTRAELSLYPIAPILGQSLLGATVIYDFAPQQTAAPDIRQTAGSFLVTESDAHFKDLIFNPLPYLKSSFSFEGARSQRNPNTFGKALIENMEGIKDETTVGLSKLSWQIASNPSFETGPADAHAMGIVHTDNQAGDNLSNNSLRTLDINPNASALPGDLTQVLNIRYDLTQSPAASIATVLSRTGVDFSKKQYVEFWMQGDGTNATGTPSRTQINLTLGQINEDSDGTGGGGFTDNRASHPFPDSNRTPRTEDLNYNNTLDVNEDVGWTYHNPNGTTTPIGAGNLVIDSQDLDRDGTLEPDNPNAGGNIGYSPTAISSISFNGSSGLNTVDHSGWQFVRIPLNISSNTFSANSADRWSSIKELRLTLHPGSGAKTGTIRIAKISIVGNKWQADAPITLGSSVTVKAINNEDDPTYTSPAGDPDFDALNQVNTALTGPTPNKRKEQALALNYDMTDSTVDGSSVTANEVTVSPMDFTPYGTIRMYVYGDGGGETFFYRAGTDTDYWEFSCPVTWRGWRQLYIGQAAPGANQRPDHWVADPRNPSPSQVQEVHGPTTRANLSNVAKQRVGVKLNTGSAKKGEIWIDEIYASDVLKRIGFAGKAASDFEIFGWGTLGLNVTDIDRNFETYTSAIANQDRHESNAYMNFTRLQWFPMKFTGSSKRTLTPAINTVSGATLVSVQQEGRVDQTNFSGAGTLQLPRFPKLGLNYDTNVTKSAQLFRKDVTNHYGATMDYTVPVNNPFLPKSVSLGYRITKLNLDFGSDALIAANDPFSVSNTRDDTRDITAKMSFQPLRGFTLNPNYSLSTTHEEKDVIFSTTTGVNYSTTTLAYDKAKTQTAGFDGVMTIVKWFAPRLRYSLTDRETYGIPLALNPTAGLFKSVDRTATGETAWDFAWRDFSHKARPLQSLNVVSSYLIEDGDSWEKVDAGYSSLNSFTVRSPLKDGNRLNLTVRDTLRSTQRWNPFDWANWTGFKQPLRTLSLTSTYTGTNQRQETTGTPTHTNTRIFPDLIFGLSQTEYFFNAQRWMSNSQMNLKTQIKKIDTSGTSSEKATTNGGDWRFTLWRKLDLFVTYTRTSDITNDLVNKVTSSDSQGEVLGLQAGFNIGKWRISPKYDQTKQKTSDASGNPTTDLTTRVPAIQFYADLYLPAGLRLPFGDLVVFSNRIRTTNTVSLTQRRSALNDLANNTDTYAFTSSNDYEVTPNVRVTVGGTYSYQLNKASSNANLYTYELNALMTIQF
jgi:hypothetical protein